MLHLNVVTPEKLFLRTDCVSVAMPGSLGELQVLPGHTPCLIKIRPGVVEIVNKQKQSQKFMVAGGFAEIDDDGVNILCDTADMVANIDKSAEQKKLAELQQKIVGVGEEDEEEFKRLQLEIQKSESRLALFE